MTPWVTYGSKADSGEESTLQFGHGGDAVGDDGHAADVDADAGASIRPRR